LKEKSGFGVITDTNLCQYNNWRVRLTTNGLYIGGLECGYDGITEQYKYISYDYSTPCWNSKLCRIETELYGNEIGSIKVGSFVVDMDNKMKILEIINSDSSVPYMEKDENFNIIKVKDVSSALDQPFINIYSYVYMNPVVVYVNESSIIGVSYYSESKGSTKIYSTAIEKLCDIGDICRLDLKVNSYENESYTLGSIYLDNAMAIKSVESTRPSEIMIRQSGDHSVEIMYPNK